MWKRRTRESFERSSLDVGFCEWAASLPFVVERPHGLSDSVRMFEIDCQPLGVRASWLMIDYSDAAGGHPTSITMIVPRADVRGARRAGRRRPPRRALGDPITLELDMVDRAILKVDPSASREGIETVVLAGYSAVLSANAA
jgi:hypothetical protein